MINVSPLTLHTKVQLWLARASCVIDTENKKKILNLKAHHRHVSEWSLTLFVCCQQSTSPCANSRPTATRKSKRLRRKTIRDAARDAQIWKRERNIHTHTHTPWLIDWLISHLIPNLTLRNVMLLLFYGWARLALLPQHCMCKKKY